MRIQVFSDIHTEFHGDFGTQFVTLLRPETVDVLIIAGDFGTPKSVPSSLATLSKLYKHARILYVLGNHEFYGSSIPAALAFMRSVVKQYNNITLLNNNMVEIGGIEFVGTTLWFRESKDFYLHTKLFADFSAITDFVPNVFSENRKAIDFLKWHVNAKSIVITHHMPTYRSVPLKYKEDPLNQFFVCLMEKMIMKRQPKVWVHGHTHDSFNYLMGKTHIMCNPLGYVGHIQNPDFLANMMIDI